MCWEWKERGFHNDTFFSKEFFLSLLNSAATKREAKQYLSRFKTSPSKSDPKTAEEPLKEPTTESSPLGVNLGSFYGAARAVYETPVFRQNTTPAPRGQEPAERLHTALIKLSTPQSLDEPTIKGIAKTFSQLVRLGMACCVVIDPGKIDNVTAVRQVAIEQANRISAAVDEQPDSKSFRLDSALSLSESSGQLSVMSRKGLLSRLRDGHVVIITPIAYMEENPKAVAVTANEAVIALTKEFAGLSTAPDPDEDPTVTAETISNLQKEVSLDRVILLHPLGGIPAFRGPQSSHVFINMEQEYDEIEEELNDIRDALVGEGTETVPRKDPGPASSILESNPLSMFVNQEIVSPLPGQSQRLPGAQAISHVLDGHMDNLRLSRQALAILPSASSGIITSPLEVANSARTPQTDASDLSAVGTRRRRNPLIHSLLTDKPLLSSSLPPGRRGTANIGPSAISPLTSHTTFIKRGMPLTVLPDPWVQMWTPQRKRVQLNDPSIDLPRLVHLIEDSFDRKLDVKKYLERVNDRIAGLIIAGEYEGGAILTWETPPGVIDDGSEESAARMVPYLDKFAVLKRSQGAGGVADVVFNAMVRSCFPDGVCWRSRKDNPVNKWYFERSNGTWKLSDSNWTMFWTTAGLPEDMQKFRDYEAVCRMIQPSWADNKSVID